MPIRFGKLISLASGAIDGLSYPVAVVAAAPIIVRMSGTGDYSKVASVLLLSGIGSLFNIVGAQGVIYTLARDDLTVQRRAAIFSATLLVTLLGMLLFAGSLVAICGYAGVRDIFAPGELRLAAVASWLLCVLISIDGLLGGAVKAHRLVALSASVELVKLVGLLVALILVSSRASWRSDALCFLAAVLFSVTAKAIIAAKFCGLRLSGFHAATKEIRRVTQVNSWQWILLLAAFFFQQADRLFIASRLGAQNFTAYNFCWQVSFVVHSASAASLVFVLPVATARASASSGKPLRETYPHDVKFGAMVSTLLTLAFVLTGSIAFNSGILPPALRAGFHPFLIMIACVYLSSLSVIPYYYLVALGWLSAVAMVNVAGAILSFLTALATVGTLGITGLALSKAWSAVTLLCYLFCHIRFKRTVPVQS